MQLGWRTASCDVRVQVINMIYNIRDESPNNVASALDNVLEALRSSELYAPLILQHVREDKVVNDLVEGLMTVSVTSTLALRLLLGRVAYVDAAYCYRRSSLVCRSVGLSVTVLSLAKTAEPIDMLFGLLSRVGPRKRIRWGLPMRRGNFEGGEGTVHCKVQGLSAVSCAKTAESLQMPFGMWTSVGPRKHLLDGVHVSAAWRT